MDNLKQLKCFGARCSTHCSYTNRTITDLSRKVDKVIWLMTLLPFARRILVTLKTVSNENSLTVKYKMIWMYVEEKRRYLHDQFNNGFINVSKDYSTLMAEESI